MPWKKLRPSWGGFVIAMLIVLLVTAIFVLLRTADAQAQINAGRYGRLANALAYSASSCVTTQDYFATPGNSGIVLYVDSTRAATMVVLRVDTTGGIHQISTTTITLAAISGSQNAVGEQEVQITFPVPQSRVRVCNTNADNHAGTVTIEVNETGVAYPR